MTRRTASCARRPSRPFPCSSGSARPCAPGSSRLTGKTVSLTCRTDPTLLGGITLRYGGIQLDDSIRSRLERLRRSLSQTVV